MRALFGLLLAAAAGACLLACGGSSDRASSYGGSDGKLARVVANGAGRGFLKDPDHDIPKSDAIGYHDVDDGRILAYYGQPAGVEDSQAITAVVKRYFAYAAAGDARAACSIMSRSLLAGVVIDYGQFGSSYLRRDKTCEAVMAGIFAHHRLKTRAPFTITGVLVKGDRGYALLGSTSVPASFMSLWREGGSWKIGRPLDGPIL